MATATSQKAGDVMAIEKCINEFGVDEVIFEEGSTGRELFVVLDVTPFLLAEVAVVGLPLLPRLATRSLNPVLQSCEHAPVTSLPDPRRALGLTGAVCATHTA